MDNRLFKISCNVFGIIKHLIHLNLEQFKYLGFSVILKYTQNCNICMFININIEICFMSPTFKMKDHYPIKAYYAVLQMFTNVTTK